MSKQHHYATTVRWTGNLGTGTSAYRAYSRDHEIRSPGKPAIPASSDPAFHGDASRYNPEELLVASLSTCHMLWYLHLCAVNKVVVLDYEDQAGGIMEETDDGGGRFLQVTLRPRIIRSCLKALSCVSGLPSCRPSSVATWSQPITSASG